MPQDQFGRELPDDDHPVVRFNSTFTKKEQVKMLLLMCGITRDLPAIEHADDDAIRDLHTCVVTDVILSETFDKLLNYLRS